VLATLPFEQELFRTPASAPALQSRHAKSQISRLEVELFQNTLEAKPGFGVKFP
jgi:hypothetical protein